MKLIVGLGNPGTHYANNRHNAGFMCVSYFARQHRIAFDHKQSQARIGAGKVAGSEIVVARPQTYMNLSGESVSLLMRKYHVELDDLLVIHDDLDLPVGKTRIRDGGGSGGHKGVDSIIRSLGTRNFPRLRIGIGRPAPPPNPEEEAEAEVISYVLSDFTPEEKQIIDATIPRASEAILCILTEGLEAAMNRFN
ncbi:MAG: aminoacyl-tRNA hydrolase [Chloroflexi bacterium]|nr:aminoacyl-tRNA hydrolase [Chloroflexota bacterium]